MHQLFMLPRESAKKQGGFPTVGRSERPLDRPLEVMGFTLDQTGLFFQPGALFGEALLDGIFDRRADLHEARRRCGLSFDSLSAHSWTAFPI